MMAEILTFPAMASIKRRTVRAASRWRAWADQHAALIDAAMDLGQTSEAKFRKRCRIIAHTEGKPVLKKMAAQLDRLAAHIVEIVTTLSMTAHRIRKLMSEGTLA